MNEQNKLHYSLSAYEMMKLNPDAKLIIYTELNKINDISELFKSTNKVIILYLLQSKTSGHWVTLFKNNEKNIFHFFDSYGEQEDAQLDFLGYIKRKQFNEEKNRLRELLKDYTVIYNNVRLQANGTATCGCFVTHRLHYYELNEVDYINLYVDNNVKYPDIFVADYCLNLFNKLKNKSII